MGLDGRSVSELWRDYSEKIAEAKDRESRSRFEAFIDSENEMIGEFEVVPLTLRKYSILSVSNFWQDSDSRVPILRFLWVMSPDFSTSPTEAKEFINDHWNCQFEGYSVEINNFINRFFYFSPAKSVKAKSKGSGEWISNMVDIFASEYGWTEDQILDLRLDRLFLYLQRIRSRNSKDAIEFSSEADKLQQEFMDIVNNKPTGRN